MSRGFWICVWTGWLMVASAQAQIIKPIDWKKVSDYNGKSYESNQSKGVDTKDYATKDYPGKDAVSTHEYATHDFSYSSKNYETKTARDATKDVATRSLPSKTYDKAAEKIPDKRYETKNARVPALPARIADKPVTDWHTLMRKEPPMGIPSSKPNELPFSEWKPSDQGK